MAALLPWVLPSFVSREALESYFLSTASALEAKGQDGAMVDRTAIAAPSAVPHLSKLGLAHP